MTNKTKGIAGAAAVAVAAVTGTLIAKRDSGPEPYVFNGFAEASQRSTTAFRDGTNHYELMFEFNPDRVDGSNGHPGIVLVFLNGERIGTNISTGFRRNMELAELKLLAATARLAESESK